MKTAVILLSAAIVAFAAPASAERVQSESAFIELVNGKTLSRPFVSLKVAPDGRISGTGAVWPVTGDWQWQDGYFCRSLRWGQDNLGYNCQEVSASGDKIRFTSDQGAGDSAAFSLR